MFRDKNKNGKADNGAELFSTATPLANGMLAANGFEALQELDSNGDGLLDLRDKAWNTLKLWTDKNGDGKTQAGEVVTLGSVVTSIDLGYTVTYEDDENGNQILGRSTVRLKSGAVRDIADIWFAADPNK